MARVTMHGLRAHIDAARRRERAAREFSTRLERQMRELTRRQETQQLCTLGRAWMALGEQSPGARAQMQRFLDSYISRETDREILASTPWAVPAPDIKTEPEPEVIQDEEHHYDSDYPEHT